MPKEDPSDRPWLCAEAIEELESIVTTDSTVFEWGAGDSTVWLARRARHVVSVEDSPTWYKRVCDRLSQAGLAHRVDLRPSSGEVLDYVMQIAGPYFFDLVIVDGKFRVQCIGSSRDHVEPNGFLVLDDSERRGYREGVALLEGWKCKVVKGRKRGSIEGQIVSTQTSFFRRAEN